MTRRMIPFNIDPLANPSLSGMSCHSGGDLPGELTWDMIQNWTDDGRDNLNVTLKDGRLVNLQFRDHEGLSTFHLWAERGGTRVDDELPDDELPADAPLLPVSSMATARILDLRPEANPGIEKVALWGSSNRGWTDFLPVRNVDSWGRPSKDALSASPGDKSKMLTIRTVSGREITIFFTSAAECARFYADLAQKVGAL